MDSKPSVAQLILVMELRVELAARDSAAETFAHGRFRGLLEYWIGAQDKHHQFMVSDLTEIIQVSHAIALGMLGDLLSPFPYAVYRVRTPCLHVGNGWSYIRRIASVSAKDDNLDFGAESGVFEKMDCA